MRRRNFNGSRILAFRNHFLGVSWKSAIPIAALFLVISACKNPIGKAGKDSGETYYRALNCQVCHRIGSEGGAQKGPDLTFVGFRKSPQWLNLWLKDPQAWKKNTPMPNFHLSSPARKSLVEYLSNLKGQAFDDHRPWNNPDILHDPILRGHLIYVRAGCMTCHGMRGEGGYPNNNVPGGLIPALTLVSQSFTKEELIKKIKYGAIPARADPNGPAPLIVMPAWGQVLSDSEIKAVAGYVLSLKPKDSSAGNW